VNEPQQEDRAPLPGSIPDVLDVEILRGTAAAPDAIPDLLVEAPHGADRRADYDALRARLVGTLPEGLHAFFHFNTDVGAWAYGRATAARVIAANPARSAIILRCLLPRTFVDCNRPADYEGGDLGAGGLTAGIPVYMRDPADRALLLDLHTCYVRAVESAFALVCGKGGSALIPHTYGPRTVDIERVDDSIVTLLRASQEPDVVERWPLRAEVDLLTRDPDGLLLAPAGCEEALVAGFRDAGLAPQLNSTYCLQPPSLGHAFSARYPGRVLTLEVRRDLVAEQWSPFEEMHAEAAKVERVAAVLAPVLAGV